MATNRRFLLVKRPVEMFTDDCFELVEEPVPEPGDGEAVVRLEYLSLDPTQRGWARDEPSYLPPVQLGEVMRGAGIGRVIASNNDAFPVGGAVTGLLGWQEYVLVGGMTGALANPLPDGIELLDAVSLYGSTGITAYFGLTDVGNLQAGETLVVSGAAGGVGSIAGQIGKILGCRVVGIAGGKEKCRLVVEELGFDDCIDYKEGTEESRRRTPRSGLAEANPTISHVGAALREACPNGIDVYFDNVGGDILDAALEEMNDFGRIVACGMISGYNAAERPPGPRNIFRIVTKRLRMQGFIVIDFLPRFAEAAIQLGTWAAEGKLQNRVHVVDGFLETPRAINMLFTGENTGKLVVKL
jgi:NADPH-dependent curcumin reductase CurA